MVFHESFARPENHRNVPRFLKESLPCRSLSVSQSAKEGAVLHKIQGLFDFNADLLEICQKFDYFGF